MATFGEIQTYISKRLLDASNVAVTSSDVALSINDSIRYWKYKEFWFNRVSDTVTLTSGDATLPVTGSFLMPLGDYDGFSIDYSSCRYPLTKINRETYDEMYLSNGNGMPRYFSNIANSYEVYPIPDQNYTVNRNYLKDYIDLVASNETNDFTNYATRLIECWSLADLSAELRQDATMEAYYRAKADDEYKRLKKTTNKQIGSGVLTISSFI